MFRRTLRFSSLVLLAATLPASSALAGFVNFESQHVHPIAFDATGTQLAVVNTPDGRLSVFDVDGAGQLVLAFEVQVGLEPVSVAWGPSGMLWVVNHLSDTVSIVDPAARVVVQTIQTGDEPTDVVFTPKPLSAPKPDAGTTLEPPHLPVPITSWAWVCISQENRIQVFDTQNLSLGQIHSIPIAGSDPRALTWDRQRGAVYAAVFESGNRTTIVPREIRADPSGPWGGVLHPYLPALDPDVILEPQFMPSNSVIVQWNGNDWVDEGNGTTTGVWTSLVPWSVGDVDVVRMVPTNPPSVTHTYDGVGTLLFDVAVDPGSGAVYVSNTEAHNKTLFAPKLQGVFASNQLTRIEPASGMKTITDVNAGLVGASRVSQPGQLAVRSTDGAVFYTAIGGSQIGVATGSGTHTRLAYREGGTGIALGTGGTRLYVVNRFTNDVSVLDAATGAVLQLIAIGRSGFDPTPTVIRTGRPFLYTGAKSQANDLACATCHPFAGMDNLAWDLGDPTGPLDIVELPDEGLVGFHPLKGPMTTQTLRGLPNTGRLHWRGDRADFNAFNGAFIELLGAADEIPAGDMQAFSDFIATVNYPPNPNVPLNNVLSPLAASGLDLFNRQEEGELFCAGCHAIDDEGSLGTNKSIIFLGGALGNQFLKVPQLRNLYEKRGFEDPTGATTNVRGFGLLHDGAAFDIEGFVDLPVLRLQEPGEQEPMIAFLESFPTGTAAGVGKQWTVRGLQSPALTANLPVLEQQAAAGNLDLIVKGKRLGAIRGYLFEPATGLYRPDAANELNLTRTQLFSGLQAGDVLTFTGVPPTCGQRLGIDRDEDGWLDFDETTYGSDPADPTSVPQVSDGPEEDRALPATTRIAGIAPNPFNPRTEIRFQVAAAGHVTVTVYAPSGARVKRIARSWMTPGSHVARWDGTNEMGQGVASGVYFVALESAAGRDTRKVVLAK